MNDEYKGDFEEGRLNDEEFNEAEFVETINKLEREFSDYVDKGDFFTNNAKEFENRLKNNEVELTSLSQAIEKNQEAFENINNGGADKLLDEVYESVSNIVLSPLGITANDFDAMQDNVNGSINSYKNVTDKVNKLDKAGNVIIDKKTGLAKEYSNIGDSKLAKEIRSNQSSIRNKQLEEKETVTDIYTGTEELIKNVEFEHITPMKEHITNPFLYAFGLKDEIKGVVNGEDNTGYTHEAINGSKLSDDWSDGKNIDKTIDSVKEKGIVIDKEKAKQAVSKAKNKNNIAYTTEFAKNTGSMLASSFIKQGQAVIVMELSKGLVFSAKEAFVDEKELSIIEKIKLFVKKMCEKFKDIVARLKDIILKIIGNTGSNLLSQITSMIGGFFMGLIKKFAGVGFIKLIATVVDTLAKSIPILFDKNKTLDEKMEAIGRLTITIVVAFGVNELLEFLDDVNILNIGNTFKMIIVAILTTIALHYFNKLVSNLKKTKQQLQLTNESLNLQSQKQILLCQNMQLYSALAMANTGYTLDYFSKAIIDVGKIYSLFFKHEKDLIERNKRLIREIEERVQVSKKRKQEHNKLDREDK